MTLRKYLFLVMLGGACANPYSKFYEGQPNARMLPGAVPTDLPLQVFAVTDIQKSFDEMNRRGFAYIGGSSWNGPVSGASGAQLRAHANTIGAQVALVSSRYTNTFSGAIPLTFPTTSTTTTSVTGTVGGTRIYGSGVSTTTGSKTVMYPYSVDRADFSAFFFARLRWRLGLYVDPLTDTERTLLQSNSGVRVRLVIEGTPAFDADILPGDFILEINGERASTVERFEELVRGREGLPTEIRLQREGATIVKTVAINRL